MLDVYVEFLMVVGAVRGILSPEVCHRRFQRGSHFFFASRRFRRWAATPPAMNLAPCRAQKFRLAYASHMFGLRAAEP